ncbi:MAG TPA: hypothetical protein VHX65_04605 [Pirellulales bacterium]|nr:hypothetical protein [Pirellulales bacterium]
MVIRISLLPLRELPKSCILPRRMEASVRLSSLTFAAGHVSLESLTQGWRDSGRNLYAIFCRDGVGGGDFYCDFMGRVGQLGAAAGSGARHLIRCRTVAAIGAHVPVRFNSEDGVAGFAIEFDGGRGPENRDSRSAMDLVARRR